MARPPKDAEELKDQRITIMMTKSELKRVDDWMFANRVRSRGEAIRRLVTSGVVKHLKRTDEALYRHRMNEEMKDDNDV